MILYNTMYIFVRFIVLSFQMTIIEY